MRVLPVIVVVGLVLAVLGWAGAGLLEREAEAVESGPPRPSNAQPVVVESVLSGDTVRARVTEPGPQVQGWGTISMRLLNIDSPNFGIVEECYAVEAQARLAKLLPIGSTAWVATDAAPRDQSGRWLMNVWGPDGRYVNRLLTVDGFVRATLMPPNDRLWAEVREGQAQAASRFGGLWGACRGVPGR